MISADGSQAFNKEIQKKPSLEDFKEHKGIEVGHIFYLGSKYSQAMSADYLDSKGKKQFIEMGCYGIGLSRTIQAVVEQSHDDKGIIWPFSVAPFTVHITALNIDSSQEVGQQAQKIYESLWSQGVDCFLDDRPVGAGVKFKDADLLGFPLRLVIGERDLKHNQIEVVFRKSGEQHKWSLDQAVSHTLNSIKMSK